MMCNSQKHTREIYFPLNRDMWAFSASHLTVSGCVLAEGLHCSPQRFSIPGVRAPVNPTAPAVSFVLAMGFTELQYCFSTNHCLFPAVWGFCVCDYRRGACRSYLFIQVHASIPHRLSSSLSVEHSSILYKRGCGVSLYWAASDLHREGRARGTRRQSIQFLFTFLWIVIIATAVSLYFARINVKRSKANEFGWVHSSIKSLYLIYLGDEH